MANAIIKQDDVGIYAIVGGWVARPIERTWLNVDDVIVGCRHFRGSQRVGMGKVEGYGHYGEYWKTDIPYKTA